MVWQERSEGLPGGDHIVCLTELRGHGQSPSIGLQRSRDLGGGVKVEEAVSKDTGGLR